MKFIIDAPNTKNVVLDYFLTSKHLKGMNKLKYDNLDLNKITINPEAFFKNKNRIKSYYAIHYLIKKYNAFISKNILFIKNENHKMGYNSYRIKDIDITRKWILERNTDGVLEIKYLDEYKCINKDIGYYEKIYIK